MEVQQKMKSQWVEIKVLQTLKNLSSNLEHWEKRLVVSYNLLKFGARSSLLVAIANSWLAQPRIGWCYYKNLKRLLDWFGMIQNSSEIDFKMAGNKSDLIEQNSNLRLLLEFLLKSFYSNECFWLKSGTWQCYYNRN